MPDFDLLIRGGVVIDGSGNEPKQCDVGIKDTKIASLSPATDATAAKVIDADGKLITPGFVDVHTHYDGQVTWDSQLQPSSGLGTTTVVMGNCGVGFAPCRPGDRELLVELMEGVEEIPGTALAEGLTWDWESFPDYLNTIDGEPRDIDFAALVPHGPLRVYVMGQRGADRQPATEEDLSNMKMLLKAALDAGAVGVSTSRTLIHRTSRGAPIPSYRAATEELKALGSVLSGENGHVFQLVSDWEDPETEFSILRYTSELTGAKGTFTLLDLDQGKTTRTPLWQTLLHHIEESQQAGLDIRGQVLSRPVGMLMGHAASMSTFAYRPSFQEAKTLPQDELCSYLARPDVKSRILAEIDVDPHIFIQIFGNQFDRMYPLEDPINYLPAREESVAHRANQAKRDPEDWLYDYLLGNDGKNLVYLPATNFSDNIGTLLKHPHTVPALGDGGAHVGSICDTSANLYLLTKWVKEKGEFELAKAVQMLTRIPAELYSLLDRGLIAEGYLADINVIDFDNLALHTPHIVHDLPAGGRRFLQHADGLELTIKSGKLTFESGKPTGALPGRLIRGRQQDPATRSNSFV